MVPSVKVNHETQLNRTDSSFRTEVNNTLNADTYKTSKARQLH